MYDIQYRLIWYSIHVVYTCTQISLALRQLNTSSNLSNVSTLHVCIQWASWQASIADSLTAGWDAGSRSHFRVHVAQQRSWEIFTTTLWLLLDNLMAGFRWEKLLALIHQWQPTTAPSKPFKSKNSLNVQSKCPSITSSLGDNYF